MDIVLGDLVEDACVGHGLVEGLRGRIAMQRQPLEVIAARGTQTEPLGAGQKGLALTRPPWMRWVRANAAVDGRQRRQEGIRERWAEPKTQAAKERSELQREAEGARRRDEDAGHRFFIKDSFRMAPLARTRART